jgi:hypothetical protein
LDGGTAELLTPPDSAKPGDEKAKPQDQEAQVPEYLLLRYFDFDVKPEKQYQYRVFLVLHNPNYHLDAAVLDDPENANKPFVGVGNEKWSEPCTSNRLPGDLRLLGGNQWRGSHSELDGKEWARRQFQQGEPCPRHRPELPRCRGQEPGRGQDLAAS